jgi:transcription antitermination factor NusG
MLMETAFGWYAIRVRPRLEKMVAIGLREKRYEHFLPLCRTRHRWSDRMKDIDVPLFPGYVFCRADFSGKPSLITTPGVIGLLSFGGAPALISDQEIEAVRAVIRSGNNVEPWPYVREGQCVRIEHGPLTGLQGFLVRKKNDWRVVLSIETLYRSVAGEIDRESVAPVTIPSLTGTSFCFEARVSRSWTA